MDRLAAWALRLIVILNVLAMTVAFGESYSGLYQWAHHHTITGFWAGVWPLMIDTIILVGEAALFASHHFRWITRHKVWAWIVTFTALGVSTAANTGHVDSTDWLSRLTAALPPLALAFCMTVGFGVMKRYYANKPVAAVTASHAAPATVLTPVSHARTETLSVPLTETLSQPLSESESQAAESRAKAVGESTEMGLSDTLLSLGFKATEKSWTMPPDKRRELKLPEKRVRDMYDVDPDISANAISKALGIAWATADKYLTATKEARGVA